jgi:2-dehydropantoate 2-reductase
MCRNPRTRELARAGMEECLAIANALGAHPQIEIERRIAGAEAVGEHRTSTLQDLDAGKRLELDALVVAVVELAELTGTPAPTLQALAASSALLAESLGLS